MDLNKTCFLIDDDYDDQLFFTLALKEVNSSMLCVTADNGKEALLKLGEGLLPDYIFIDLNMPGMNGIECMIKIKDLQHLKNTPVIIYTTSNKRRDILETGVLGAKAFITKPYDIGELSRKLSDFFHLENIN